MSALLVGACSNSHTPSAAKTLQNDSELGTAATALESFAEVRRNPLNGTITSARSDNLARMLDGDSHYQTLMRERAFLDMAIQFLEVYRKDFQLNDPQSELVLKRSGTDTLGYQQVRLEQVFKGLPVVGAELLLQFDAQSQLNLIQGVYVPTPNIDPKVHRYSATEALAIGVNKIGTEYEISGPDLVIFPLPDGLSALAYEMKFSRGLAQGWRVVIDANDGSVLSKVSNRHTN